MKKKKKILWTPRLKYQDCLIGHALERKFYSVIVKKNSAGWIVR